MKLGLGTVLAAGVCLLAVAGYSDDLKTQVENTAKGREEALRSANIRFDDNDRQAIRYLERFRADVVNTRKSLAEYQRAYKDTGDLSRNKELADARKRLEMMMRQQRISLDGGASSESIMSYYEEVKKYRDEAGRKKRGEWLTNAKKNFPTYEREVGEAVKQIRAGKPVKPTKQPETPKPPTGGGGGGGGDLSRLEVYVGKLSGDMEFYINGQEVKHARQTFPMNPNGTLTLRAVALEPNRKRFRTMQGTERVSITAQDDHQLRYETVMSGYTASTHWQVQNERYTWSVTQRPNINTEYDVVNSGKPGVSQDQVTFKVTGRFSYAANVNGLVDWKATSKRPGGNREQNASGKASGAIMISVGARG